jgi:hypothetical protein
MSLRNNKPIDETVLIELCHMWSSAMRISPDLELEPDEMKKIGDRLLNTEAQSIETILLKFRSAHDTALRSLSENNPVRNILESAIKDLDRLDNSK